MVIKEQQMWFAYLQMGHSSQPVYAIVGGGTEE